MLNNSITNYETLEFYFCIKYCNNFIQHMGSKLLLIANFIVVSFYLRCKEDSFYHFFLSLLFQVEGGAGRGEAGQDGAGDDPPGQPRPPPGLAL